MLRRPRPHSSCTGRAAVKRPLPRAGRTGAAPASPHCALHSRRDPGGLRPRPPARPPGGKGAQRRGASGRRLLSAPRPRPDPPNGGTRHLAPCGPFRRAAGAARPNPSPTAEGPRRKAAARGAPDGNGGPTALTARRPQRCALLPPASLPAVAAACLASLVPQTEAAAGAATRTPGERHPGSRHRPIARPIASAGPAPPTTRHRPLPQQRTGEAARR